MLRSVAEAAEQSATKLVAATKDLAKSQTAKTLAAFDAADAQAKTSDAACQLQLGAVEVACSRLREAGREAGAFAVQQESQLQRLRQQIAEKQRAEELKKAATRWRRHFAECKRLAQGQQQLRSLTYCDAACEAVTNRMDAERFKLGQFEYTESVDEPRLLKTLVGECRANGCDVCPKE